VSNINKEEVGAMELPAFGSLMDLLTNIEQMQDSVFNNIC
jgi:hypothetical protein